MKLIDKSTVVAEIERIMAEEMSFFKDCCKDGLENTSSPIVYTRMEMLLSFLNTLEVKDMDEMIKNAEDHAYFAGSEAMRVKFIEKACDWLRIELVNFEDYIGMGETFIEDFKNYMKGE